MIEREREKERGRERENIKNVIINKIQRFSNKYELLYIN
jgi:hypothetical protein